MPRGLGREERIAVCQNEVPDARALRGLSPVAAAKGPTDDAEVFAAEAEALGSLPAQVLRGACRLSDHQAGRGGSADEFQEDWGHMSIDGSPRAGSPSAASAVDSARITRESDKASYAESVAAQGSTLPIPAEVWDQVNAAARVAENLHAEGRALRFDVQKLDGSVVASLVDNSGLLRPILLEDVVDPGRLTRELGMEA